MEIKQEYQCGCLLDKTEELDQVCFMVEQSIVQTAQANYVCPKATVIAAARVLGSMIGDLVSDNKFDMADYKAMIIAQIDVGVIHFEKAVQVEDGQRVDN